MTERAAVPDPVPPRPDCRIVSYNVLYQGVAPDGRNWADRGEMIADELDRLAPDVVAFQEIWLDQLPDLRESLPDYRWIATADSPKHTPIAYRADRFDLADSGTFWLSPPDAEPGAAGWDAKYQRLVTHATLDDPAGTRPVTVASVHLDHKGRRARRDGVTLIRDRFADLVPDDRLVLAGDFNCRPGDPAYRRAIHDREGWQSLSDAATIAASTAGPTETYTGFPEEDAEPRNIDHVFVSDGFDVKRVVTCVPSTDERPSDHRPVLVELSY